MAVALAAFAVLGLAPTSACALFGVGDIVSDPRAQAKNVEKVAQMLLQLEQLAQQIEQLQAQVADLGTLLDNPGGDTFERAGQMMDGLTSMQQTLDQWRHALPVQIDPQSITVNDLPQRNAEVRAYLQERLVQVEASLSTLEQDRAGVTIEVAAVVEAGNAAEGPKAAQQAANQLQALIAAEQAKLQALRALRSRLATDADAAAQAEEAAAEAVRQREMALRQSVETLHAEGQRGMTGGN